MKTMQIPCRLCRHLTWITILLVAGSCGTRQEASQVSLHGMVFGTYYSVIYYDAASRDFQQDIDSLFAAFNQSLSYYQENSLVSRINRNESDRVDDWFRTVYLRAESISRETRGAFDATVSPLVNAWGFGFSERAVMDQGKVDSLMAFVGHDRVRLEGDRIVKDDPRVQFDFNAIAKGYAADVVGGFLESEGITTYLVEIGGDLLARGLKPDGSAWKVGLERPAESMDAPQQWDYYVEVADVGLATSGNYRRYYEDRGQRYSHTISPQTGYPVDHSLLSASVFAPDAMSADAYATAFMVMGPDAALRFVEERDDLEAFFVYAAGENGYETRASSGLILKRRPR